MSVIPRPLRQAWNNIRAPSTYGFWLIILIINENREFPHNRPTVLLAKKPGPGGPGFLFVFEFYCTFSAVSSITKEVCRLASSLPTKWIWMVCPLKLITLNECCW